jgi:Fur family ferric uptake transcriptional regulator
MSDIFTLLKAKGFRLTQPRKEILQVLEAYPRTVQELQSDLIHKQVKVDLASIYRTLELLESLNVVQSVDLGEGKKRFELLENDHHHHVICRRCGAIEDVCINEEKLITDIATQSKYTVENHTIEFFGTCPTCDEAKSSDETY